MSALESEGNFIDVDGNGGFATETDTDNYTALKLTNDGAYLTHYSIEEVEGESAIVEGESTRLLVEGEGGSEAYKIELSTDNPEDFTEDDIDNLNAFWAAVEEDPSIIVGSYICVGEDGIYRYTAGYYDSENEEGEFDFDNATPWGVVQIAVMFENGEYNATNTSHNNYNTLYPSTDFPANPEEGTIANYNDGNGNIGFYQYDGSDWQPYGGGEGGDSTILKASSSIPSGLTLGDVYALAGGDTEWNLIDGDIPEGTKLVKVQVVNDGTYTFYWSDFDYVGIDYSEGSFSNPDGMTADGENKWSIDNASGSVEYDGEYLIATLTGDESWKSVDGNSVGGDKYYGEEKFGGLFQHIMGGDKVIAEAGSTSSARAVYIKVYDFSAQREYLGYFTSGDDTQYDIYFSGQTAELVSNDTTVATVSLEETATVNDGAGDFDFSFTSMSSSSKYPYRIRVYGSSSSVKFTPNFEESVSEAQVVEKKFLTADDIPAENRLVPEGGSEGDVLMKNNDDTSGWATIRQVPMTDMDKDYTGYMLGAKSGWADEIGWIPVTEMYPVEEGLVGDVPLQGGDGKVYSKMDDNGEYGIVQAQGEETVVRADDDWVPLDYTDDWSKITGFTELRISDSSEAAFFAFRFGSIECEIRYESSEWSSDSITVSSSSGEFTNAYVNDDANITLSCANDGAGHLVITFSTAVDAITCGNEDGSAGAEFNNLPLTKYANAVTSFDVRRIVKISQSDYDDLVTNDEVDEHTLYMIISSNA